MLTSLTGKMHPFHLQEIAYYPPAIPRRSSSHRHIKEPLLFSERFLRPRIQTGLSILSERHNELRSGWSCDDPRRTLFPHADNSLFNSLLVRRRSFVISRSSRARAAKRLSAVAKCIMDRCDPIYPHYFGTFGGLRDPPAILQQAHSINHRCKSRARHGEALGRPLLPLISEHIP